MMKSSIVVTALVLAFFFSGCRKFHQDKIVADAEPYHPTNLYPIERLPKYFNRVAVLPCYYPDPASQILSFSDNIFLKELSKVGIFEPVEISPDFCLMNFNKERISSTESLPENFFTLLDEKYGVNGVLFIDLHSYKPYRPISLGIRSKLVDLKTGEFMWAIDETIDAGDASVMVSVNSYQRSLHVQSLSQKTSSSILQSPRLFTKFTAYSVFSTLPTR